MSFRSTRVVPTRHDERAAHLVICPADHRLVYRTPEEAHAEARRHRDCAPRPSRPRLSPMPPSIFR